MRLAAVFCVLATPLLLAQRDPLPGAFQGDKVTLELKGSAGRYSGTLTVQGQAMPVAVVSAGASANGTFSVDGRSYAFTLTPYGNGLKLASEGVEYLLVRKTEAAPA